MREIVIDTETTGLDPRGGHRIVEVACLELMHHIPTGRKFHRYVNPERDMPEEAYAVHGLSAEFLAEHPRFAEIVDEMLDFIGEDRVVIHNAEFDLAFLNAELARLGRRNWPARLSIRWRWRASAFPVRRPASTRCAGALRSISACARSTAPISIAASWPRSISNCSAAGSRRSLWWPTPPMLVSTRNRRRCGASRARRGRTGRPRRS